MGSEKLPAKDLQAQIHRISMGCCKILLITVDMEDPGRITISEKYLSELKGQARELLKEAEKLP